LALTVSGAAGAGLAAGRSLSFCQGAVARAARLCSLVRAAWLTVSAATRLRVLAGPGVRCLLGVSRALLLPVLAALLTLAGIWQWTNLRGVPEAVRLSTEVAGTLLPVAGSLPGAVAGCLLL